MKIKWICFLLGLLFSTVSSLADSFEYENITYAILDEEERTCAIQSQGLNSGSFWRLDLPSHPKDGDKEYTLVEISNYAFYNIKIEELTVPNTVKKIGSGSLDGTGLSKLIIEDGEEPIGLCYDLGFTVKTITDLYMGRDWYVDDAKSFSLFPNVETLILGKYVKNIPSYAFFKAKLNEELILPETLVSIGEKAFFDTQISGDLIIPSSVTSISSDSFSECSNIKRCICPERFRFQMNSLGYMIFYPDYNSQFNEDGCLYSNDKTKLYYVPLKFCGEYELPSSVTSIGDYAFAYCDQVTSVKLPSSLKGLGTGCFEGCSQLSGEFDIPEGVKILNSNTFKDCKRITKIKLHDNISSIQSEAFSGCSSLESMKLSSGIERIYYGLFSGCTSLSEVTLPEGIQSIYSNAFSGCDGLTTINIPESVISLGSGVFKGCSSLNNINIPESVTSIGISAFQDCGNLREIVLPEGLVNIPQSCFQDCASLNKVTLKGVVAEIGLSAFQGCNDLKDFVISKSLLPALEGDNFSETNYLNTLLTIPENIFIECLSSSWSAFRNLKVGENMSVLFSDGIFDYREFPGDDVNRAVLIKGNYSGLHSANIPDRFTDDKKIRYYITMIAPGAFKGCTNLNSLTFSDRSQIDLIGENAFSGCTGLKSVELPSSLSAISDEAFRDCTSIEYVAMNPNVKKIGEGAFRGCVNLKEINLSENLTLIPRYLFSECVALESVEIPEGVTTISEDAFYHTGLRSLVIPSSVENIGSKAFAECDEIICLELVDSPACVNISNDSFSNASSLKTLKIERDYTNSPFAGSGIEQLSIGNNVTSINESAYKGCVNLAKLSLGIGLKSISDNAFNGCLALTELVAPPYVSIIGSGAFEEVPLDKICLGNNIESVGDKAFYGSNPQIVAITAQRPPEAFNTTFSDYGGMLLVDGDEDIKDLYDDTDKCWYRFRSSSMIVAERIETDQALTIMPDYGSQVTLNARVYPGNATLPYIFWHSTNQEVATVDNDGVVTFRDNDVVRNTQSEDGEECSIIASTLYNDGPVLKFTVGDTATGINLPHGDDFIGDGAVGSIKEICDINGRRISANLDMLPKGIYIVRTSNGVYKIAK